jgi:hypothetical protein
MPGAVKPSHWSAILEHFGRAVCDRVSLQGAWRNRRDGLKGLWNANGAKVDSPRQRLGRRHERDRAEGPQLARWSKCRAFSPAVPTQRSSPLGWAINFSAVGAPAGVFTQSQESRHREPDEGTKVLCMSRGRSRVHPKIEPPNLTTPTGKVFHIYFQANSVVRQAPRSAVPSVARKL